LAVPIERLWRDPSFEDDVDRLAHHVALRRRQLAAQATPIADAQPETGHIAAVRQVIANGSVGRDLQRMEIGQRADAGPHLDPLGQSCCLANERIGRGQLVGGVIGNENAVLADPGFVYAERVGEDDLLQILFVAGLGNAITPLAIRKKPEPHSLHSLGPL